ncbi:MAG TPA: O-antigen ligase family protein [bacterium]|nr:O-antigen ligase family protein [bacterium]HPL95497.1 O-antigen ligase family protein [bacterium]
MSSFISKKYFKITFFLLILAEILSYLSWANHWLNTVCFVAIILATLFLSLYKLKYGLYILLAELFVGSKGYLFSVDLGNTVLSIRMGIFIVVMAVFLVNVILRSVNDEGSREKQSKTLYKINSVFRRIPRSALIAELGMTIIVVWAFVWGIIRGNDFGNVFLDFNNWLYWLVALPMTLIYTNKNTNKHKFIINIISILCAAGSVIFLKTIFLFYIFTHQVSFFLPEIYQWVRDTNVAEITHVAGNVWRIFMPAQIYVLILFFILFVGLKFKKTEHKIYSILIDFLLPIFCLAVLIISFSRSFWVGLIAGLLSYLVYFIITKEKFFNILKQIGKIILFLFASLVLVSAIYFLPPKPVGDWASILGQRLTQGEAASAARLNQLTPLWQGIKKHPLIGSGFGATFTYFSTDPRLINETAGQSGEVTTYASEWGYLDMILKFGLVGLGIYLYLFFLIIKKLLKFETNSNFSNLNQKNHNSLFIIHYSFGIALVALLAVNIFTPYLNHPLGIGFIVLIFIFQYQPLPNN